MYDTTFAKRILYQTADTGAANQMIFTSVHTMYTKSDIQNLKMIITRKNVIHVPEKN